MSAGTVDFTQRLYSQIPENFNQLYAGRFLMYLTGWFVYWGLITIIFNQFFKKHIKSSDAMFEFTCKDTINRWVSTTNGHLCVFIALYNIIWHPAGFNDPNTVLEQNWLVFFASYNMYDTFACWWLKVDDAKLYIHHCATLIHLMTQFSTGYGVHVNCYTLVAFECTHFSMTFRRLIEYFGGKYTKAKDFLDYTYFYLYIAARGLVSPVTVVIMLTSSNVAWLVGIACGTVQLQSFGSIMTMRGLLRKKAQEKKLMMADGWEQKKNWFSVCDELKSKEFDAWRDEKMPKRKGAEVF